MEFPLELFRLGDWWADTAWFYGEIWNTADLFNFGSDILETVSAKINLRENLGRPLYLVEKGHEN